MNEFNWHNRARKRRLKKVVKYRMEIINSIEILTGFPKQFPINVKKLKNHQYDYRMRVGRYRILFNHKETVKVISIEEVKKRDERTY